MFMLPFETRDSKHCCFNVVLVVRREYYALYFVMVRQSQSISRSYFWCERLARGLVQNLLKTKEDVFLSSSLLTGYFALFRGTIINFSM